MQTTIHEYKKMNNSSLYVSDYYQELFYMNIVEVPLLEEILKKKTTTSAYYPTLYRDIWFMIEQPYEVVQFSKKVDFSNEVLAEILKAIYEHPTFHIIHDINRLEKGSSFMNALLLTEMVSVMIDGDLEILFDVKNNRETINLATFIDEHLEVGNCLECAAQSILHSSKELPIYFDMNIFVELPITEKTQYSLEVLQETNLLEDLNSYKEVYM